MIEVVKDLEWSFRGKERPNVRYGLGRLSMDVDPTPGYAHDIPLVEKTLRATKRSTGKIPKIDVRICIFHYEGVGRTNGWAESGHYWSDETDKWEKEPLIILQGKRIPIHPAMTRYLVSHEYGHHIQWLLEKQFGLEEDAKEFIDRYSEVRGVPPAKYYGPGQWHLHPWEVFANDFRVTITGIESEFWPHEVKPLAKGSKLYNWWMHLKETRPSKWEML